MSALLETPEKMDVAIQAMVSLVEEWRAYHTIYAP